MIGAFDLATVAPWGRGAPECAAFFDLPFDVSGGPVLDCAGGPSSFNAELAVLGGRVVSADPIYARPAAEIARAVEAARPRMLAGLALAHGRFVWDRFPSPAALDAARMTVLRRFLDDLTQGRTQGRYVAAALPHLPFPTGRFALALSSHFLFTYSGHLDRGFHEAAVLEMLRVAREVRIFPLLDLDGALSRHLRPVLRALDRAGAVWAIRRVAYEFQRGGNRTLIVRPARAMDNWPRRTDAVSVEAPAGARHSKGGHPR